MHNDHNFQRRFAITWQFSKMKEVRDLKNQAGQRSYLAIDLKSFYASVECRERALDPLDANLVVADPSRTDKTICLAVSPALKAYGIPGRARLFEVVQRVKEINAERRAKAPGHQFRGESCFASELQADPGLALAYETAPPRMALYMQYSKAVYQVYLKYIAPEDIHIYSIDEVFMDVTGYLVTYELTPHELAMRMIRDILEKTGVTATAGIGTNLYLCKIAMDIVAKHMPPDEQGVRIAELDELSYRKLLWTHEPLTDFWRVGRGYAKKLKQYGIETMGDIARCSLGGSGDFYNEELLYRLFGVNAELLIDHAWGWEPVTIQQIKAYKPRSNSISSGQVLSCPYDFEHARIVLREMVELLALELVEKGLVTDQVVLTVGYDRSNLDDEKRRKRYHGPVTVDRYGRSVPKHARGTAHLPRKSSSTKMLTEAMLSLYNRYVDPELLIRRLTVVADQVILESEAQAEESYQQLSLFDDNFLKQIDPAAEKGSSTMNAAAEKGSSTMNAAAEKDSSTMNAAAEKGSSTMNAAAEKGSSTMNAAAEKGSSTMNAAAEKGGSTMNVAIEKGNSMMDENELEKEKHIQQAMLSIKKKYGKNAILRGTDLQEGATMIARNSQIGGHKA